MPVRKRQRREPTYDWQKIEQLVLWPEQEQYERLRPIVLFGQTAAERAKETGTPERPLLHQVKQFEQEGMASLFRKERNNQYCQKNGQREICQGNELGRGTCHPPTLRA
jgi:hypothetical protein